MLDYIKQQLQAMNPAPQEEAIQEQLMDQAVLECAHLFQEFDDLTMNGTITNGARQFANVDIPLEDDLEITTVEMDLLSGRVVDVPMDATVQEFTYGQMKTFEDFLQEAFDNTSPMGRETRDVYEDRCYHIAEMEYKKYSDYIIQEGLFGFDKIKIDDPRVPTEAKMHCGMRKGEPYVVYLDVYFIVDKKHRLTKKQLESINVFKSVADSPMSGEIIQKVVFEQYGGMCGCPSMKDVWDYAKPTKLVVPVEPTDMYCVLIEFEFNDIEQKKRLCWMVPIKGKGKSETPSTKDFASSLKSVPSGKFSNMHGITKKEGKKHIAESASVTLRELNRFGNSGYYQEGIDFGDPNEAPAAEPDNSSVAQSEAPAPDANAAGGDVSAPPAEGADTGAPKEVANVNNVSDAIAEKVSDETQNDAAEEGLNVDGVDDATSDADVSDIDTSEVPSESEVDADLGDVDANAEDGGEATSDVDVDNMTPEELKAAAADKIEKMTFQQIKDFLNNQEAAPATDEVPAADGEVQEAFFLTRGNIGKELDIHLRKTLGILNDSDMEIEQLCSEFRKQGKRLNRVVHKATKMTDVFNEVERKQLLKLNALLTDLMAMMRADLDRQGVQAVKRLIRAFVQQATGVAKLVEQHKPDKPVQEAYYPPKDLNRFKSHIAECESIIGRPLPDGYKRLLEYGIENIGIKGADGWFQGCEWEIFDSSLRDRDKYDYAGHPGSEFIPLANNGRGDEILMGNTSKTDTRIFTYIHDVQNGLKQISKSWDEFEDLLYTREESDAKYDTMKMKFFGKECPVRIPRGISLKDTCTSIDFANKCDELLNDSVRTEIRDIMEKCKGDFSDEELKSADWRHPEKHMKPVYIYVNDHIPRAPRADGRYDWKIMLDCDWDFDEEHGLAIMFDENMKLKNVGQAGNYL